MTDDKNDMPDVIYAFRSRDMIIASPHRTEPEDVAYIRSDIKNTQLTKAQENVTYQDVTKDFEIPSAADTSQNEEHAKDVDMDNQREADYKSV